MEKSISNDAWILFSGRKVFALSWYKARKYRFFSKFVRIGLKKKNLVLLCGHYEGVDQRVLDEIVDEDISIGDYVLTGGELAACVIADSVVRIIPGAIGDEASALTDCFQDNLLAPPVYTRPSEFNGWKVPDVLLSGNFAEIEKWQEEQSFERTKRLRPDLLERMK